MKASIVDLRYHMNTIREAIDRNQIVNITCHGKTIANIIPCHHEDKSHVEEHPFFGSQKNSDVEETMKQLRGNRYDDL